MTGSYIGARAALDLLTDVGGIDPNVVLNWNNRNGLNAEQVVERLAGAIGTANQQAFNRWSPFFFTTTAPDVKYPQGGSISKTPVSAEFANQDAKRGELTGHLLPLRDYDAHPMAWTQQFLRDAYEAHIDADIQVMADEWFLRVDADMINRMFSITEEVVGGGYSVPWAIGSGVNVVYIPPAFGAKTFTTSHTHFIAANVAVTAANLVAKLKLAVKDIREHGINGRLVALVSEDDVDTWVDATGFVELLPTDIQYVGAGANYAFQTSQGEFEGMAGQPFGYVKSNRGYVELRYLEQVPTGYFHVTRSYGPNNPNNGLAVRLHPDVDFGLAPEIMLTSSINPRMESIQAHATHGVGINKRLNGVSVYLGGSSYTWTNI